MDVRLEIPPAPVADVLRLERKLGVSCAVAQVLVRRGLGDPSEARAFLAADDRHDPSELGGMGAAVALIREHLERGSRIVVHGDYDADGVCATAILVRALRALGADVGWFLPSRTQDGYGLSTATVERLAAAGTGLLVTADCAVTAVDEVARARELGMGVVVTDHHQRRADGALPQAPVVHPQLGTAPTAELCAAGVAYKLSAALLAACGRDPALADGDLDVVALATVADCVPLRGENRRLVREGLVALARTRRPGLRALLRVVQADPAAIDEQTIAFRLAPRINAAGRLQRADAGVELLLTEDPERADAIAAELDAANAERRHVETRILFEAEAQVAELGERPAYVLAADGWHPGVIGIVAARIAERHHRPAVLVALDGERGTGSGRSIPAFDLLAGLDACAGDLLRHGGHRAAAGCTVERERVAAFRAAFEAHAAAVLTPEDLVPRERVDAVVGGADVGMALAEELAGLAPYGIGNPRPALLIPAATLGDPRPMGEGKHVRFTVEAGAARAAAVAFGRGSLPAPAGEPVDATFTLEVNRWRGREDARLVLRQVAPAGREPIVFAGRPEAFLDAALAELDAPLPGARVPDRPRRAAVDRRGASPAALIAALASAGEPVLVVAACEERRARALRGRLGGFALCSWTALCRDPALAGAFAHVVALDPPSSAAERALLHGGPGDWTAHLAWGEAELRFTHDVLEHDHELRGGLAALYRALRDGEGAPLEAALRGDAQRPRTPARAGRLLRVLVELGLVALDRDRPAVEVPPAQRTELERSAAFRAYAARREEGLRWLTRASARAA